jgi:hypothetical protein
VSEAKRKEMLAEALEHMNRLERLGEVYGDSDDWGAIGLVRRVLRRQGMLLTLGALLLCQTPRDEAKIAKWIEECRCEQHDLSPAEIRAIIDGVEEKPVPGPQRDEQGRLIK